ncbi:MAG: hypothetical protein RID15_04490 [Marinovum algicola]|jgi:hypothetical protein|uniref:Lipoprotein n=1 Tax=Marinovum algicola TaxID=42444 RepID=A0A975ZMI9_9RHOB|nr:MULTISPECIES: hypothetical protein [Marinovum]AKO96916.1 hypothetical protein MALG_01744 [Marinovum algicola DG 898]MDD9740788.1 hypothetical protein [Marinovum sp. SP66]SEJ07564.1 hypothetical protein SAMN04487940_103147 [Marinovum algicola]SLN19748.1 hypothetical protein MAA5396_00660 [Marinovum algicola]
MRKLVLASLVVATSLAGCAAVRDSRVNPANWFGRSETVATPPAESEVNTLIPERRAFFGKRDAPPYEGALVEQVTELHIRQVAGGAVVEVSGVLTSIEGYDVRLVALEEAEAGSLSYEFRAVQPRYGEGVGNAHARAVTAAIRLTEQELAGIRTIRVVARDNIRSASR